MNKLTEIANRHETDKGSVDHGGYINSCHNYTEFYYDYFQKLKDSKKKVYILEIGVYTGGSLEMYNEFFENNCEIYAIDIDLSKNKYSAPNVHLYQFDATVKDNVENFVKETNNIKFDIIIDDGSHRPLHQFRSLLYFHNLVNEDSIYILEDLHTYVWGYISDSPLYFLNFNNNPGTLLQSEIDELKKSIDTVTINIRNNEKSELTKQSITSVIKFKK